MDLPNMFKEILSFAKESTKTFFIIGGLCTAVIFFSDLIGTEVIRESTDPYLKAILLICALGITANFIQFASKICGDKYTSYKGLVRNKRFIKLLTPIEKEVLWKYVELQTRVQSLNLNSGIVTNLVKIGAIYESTHMFDDVFGANCQFNISDWWWEYLNENPDLIRHNYVPKK
jgi:hypothetical protein